MDRKQPTKKQQEESDNWNSWKPGSGRKGWSPFNKSIPPLYVARFRWQTTKARRFTGRRKVYSGK